MKKLILCAILGLAVSFSATSAQAGDEAIKALLADAAFTKKTNDQKLAHINQMIAEKKIKSYDVSDYSVRLVAEMVAPLATPAEKFAKMGEVKTKYSKLSSMYDLEKFLIVDYLTNDPTAKAADLKTKIKMIHDLKEAGKVSWPGMADISTGMLAYLLVTDPEFSSKSVADKVMYLRALENTKSVTKMTSAPFIEGMAVLHIAGQKDAAAKKSELTKLLSMVGFFAESGLKKGFVDLMP